MFIRLTLIEIMSSVHIIYVYVYEYYRMQMTGMGALA